MSNKFYDMLKVADRRNNYSKIEKKVITYLLEYCHATDVRWTPRKMFEVFFACDAMPSMELTTCDCEDKCARYGCSTSSAANDVECLISRDKAISEAYMNGDLWFNNEIKAILKKYKGENQEPLDGDETEYLAKRVLHELDLIEGNITQSEFENNINK